MNENLQEFKEEMKKQFHKAKGGKSNRNTIILLIVLALLILGYSIFSYSQNTEYARPQNPLISNYTEDEVFGISISNNGEGTELIKTQDEWRVASFDNYIANTSSVEAALNEVSRAAILETASTNPENYENYNISEEIGTHVVLKNSEGEITNDFLIGRATPDRLNVYVKNADDPNIYIIKGQNIKTFFEISDWRSKNLVHFSVEDIKDLSITEDALPTYRLTQSEGSFSLELPEKNDLIDQGESLRLFTALTNAQAKKILSDVEKLSNFGLEPDSELLYSISATLQNDENYSIVFGMAEDDRYYAQVNFMSPIFEVEKEVVDTFHVDSKKLIPQVD